MIVHYSAGLFLGGFAMLHQNNPRELFMDVAFDCIFHCEKEKIFNHILEKVMFLLHFGSEFLSTLYLFHN